MLHDTQRRAVVLQHQAETLPHLLARAFAAATPGIQRVHGRQLRIDYRGNRFSGAVLQCR